MKFNNNTIWSSNTLITAFNCNGVTVYRFCMTWFARYQTCFAQFDIPWLQSLCAISVRCARCFGFHSSLFHQNYAVCVKSRALRYTDEVETLSRLTESGMNHSLRTDKWMPSPQVLIRPNSHVQCIVGIEIVSYIYIGSHMTVEHRHKNVISSILTWACHLLTTLYIFS
jgi:hypothetical protein